MTVDKEKMARRLEPNHLKDVTEADIKAELDQAREKPSEPQENLNDPKLSKEYPFQFSWTNGRGKIWKGAFTNKILSIRERQMVGVMRARLAAGMPLESLDSMTQEINLMVSHLSFSLTERPEWAKDLLELDDVQLLQEIYMEVLRHEATFRGHQPVEGTGAI